MLADDQVLSLAEQTLREVEADQADVMVWQENLSLTRFAESFIHQNVQEENIRFTIRAVVNKQSGCATTNRTDPAGLRAAAQSASRAARHSAPNPEFRSLAAPKAITPADGFVQATADSTPEARADAVAQIIREATAIGAVASGSLSTSFGNFAVANSLGIRTVEPWTRGKLVTVIADSSAGDASGYAEWRGKDISEMDPLQAGQIAAQKCAASRGQQTIPPGQYIVVLEEPAVADLLDFLAYLGLGATSYQEGRSFMCGQLGKKIVTESISLWDDGHDPRQLPMAFDYEGVPKQKVMLIQNGIAQGVVYDSYTAGKEGKESTGHALPATSTFGPFPMNLCLAPGTATKEEMIDSTERGIFITRFHYTNVISPRETIITGMTRDGTFLIENGKITRPIYKLRFTENIIEALKRVEMLGREVKLSGEYTESLVPALKIDAFTFTS